MRLIAIPQLNDRAILGRAVLLGRAALTGACALVMLLLAVGESHAQLSYSGHDNAGGAGAPAHMSLDESAAAGDPYAAFMAGRRQLIMAANTGNPDQRREGLALIAQAADNGFAPAARFGGALFLEGELVEPDAEQAIHWFTRAAKLGDVAAQLDLGDLFSNGRYVPVDLARAAHWYQTALDNPAANYQLNNLYEVAYHLGEMYAEGSAGPVDGAKARALWQDVADQTGYPPAYRALAHAYAEGIGGPVDVKASFDLYMDAATAYREAGIRFAIIPTDARREVADILLTVEGMEARSKVLRKIKKEMELIEVK